MNETEWLELQQIRATQSVLATQLADLDRRLARYEAPDEAQKPVTVEQLPPPLPVPGISPAIHEIPPRVSAPVFQAAPVVADAARVAPTPEAISLEMKIGGTWFVRVGIALLLTSLAFLGNYLYQTVVPHLGPAAKVALLYLTAGAVAGTGAWLERSAAAGRSERLRQYARVILAGGLAAVYYVTYAAHHLDGLRIVTSPLLGGCLLLAWATFMVCLAERRRSETLATVAILLAYYTSAINEGVAGFTLVSNVILSSGAVYLMRRHLWQVFPFASLLATFGSYAFWNYFHSILGWRGFPQLAEHQSTGGRMWIEGAFLLVYWLLFTWAAFSRTAAGLSPARRALFISLNNGAFFSLGTWLLLGEYPDAFWKWALLFGACLICLAEASRRSSTDLGRQTEAAYVGQGVLLVTLGFVTYFTGWHLSLLLAVETVALTAAAGWRRQRLLLAAAYVTGLLSAVGAVWTLLSSLPERLWFSALAEGAFLIAAAWQSRRLFDASESPAANAADHRLKSLLSPAPGIFAFLGLAVWLGMIECEITSREWLAPTLAFAAVVSTILGDLLRVKAIARYAQGFLLLSVIHWLGTFGEWKAGQFRPPFWNPLVILTAILFLGHWWRERGTKAEPQSVDRLVGPWNALLLTLLLYAWLHPLVRAEFWMLTGSAIAVALLVYGCATRFWTVAIAGQMLLVSSAGEFLLRWGWAAPGYDPSMWAALGPLIAVCCTWGMIRRFAPGEIVPKSQIGAIYETIAMFLFLCWVSKYFPRSLQFSTFAVTGAAVCLAALWSSDRPRLWLSAIPSGIALLLFFLVYGHPERRHWIHLVGIGTFAVQQRIARRYFADGALDLPKWAQTALITAATLSGWALLTAWMVSWRQSNFTLAAGWSVYAAAAFIVGLALRERPYRWVGLLILACTLLRIATVDLWRLDSLERVVSGFCVSLILLALGYFYNRYHESWKEFL